MEYTKGEWDKDGNKVKVHGRGIIAICPSPTENHGVLEFVANAHLIASAPDLYEACKAVEDYLNAAYPDNLKQKKIMFELVEKAIAKVEGD